MLNILEANRSALLPLIGAASRWILRRFHSRVAGLEFSLRPGDVRDPAGPRIPISIAIGRISRTGWLIAIESRALEDQAASTQRADRHGALEDLREMVVDGILLERTRHRVVGTKGRKALPQRDGSAHAVAAESLGRCKDQLVKVGVRMPAIDVPLTGDARVQLTSLQRCSLQIERPLQREQFTPRVQLGHDSGLGHVALSQSPTLNRG